MSLTAHPEMVDSDCALHGLLDEPEENGLLRLTKLAEHLFHVPAAYVALLGPDLKVDCRIGSGAEHWDNMKTFPLDRAFGNFRMWPDPSGSPVEGFDPGRLQFAAWVPLRSRDGLDLGLLVLLDVKVRPDFTPGDHDALAELACLLAGKMELRRLALQARESELLFREAERRFRSIANSAPVMIIYAGVDGSSSFVNSAWLEFTGRALEDEVGEGFEDRFHPNYRESVMQSYWDAFQARRPLTVEFPMLRHDGEYRWMQARGVPRFLDDGRYVGYIGSFIDLTDQRAAMQNLHVQASCMAAIADAAGVSWMTLDAEGRIEQGGEREKTRGRFIWETVDNGDGDALRGATFEALAGRRRTLVHAAHRLWTLTPVMSEADEVVAVAVVVETLGR